MFAAVFVIPSITTLGIVTPTARPLPSTPASFSERFTIRAIAGTTASGADGWGVATRSRVETSVPCSTSTTAALIPLPPTSTPTARPCLVASTMTDSEVVDGDPAVDHEVRPVRPAALVRREVDRDVDDL